MIAVGYMYKAVAQKPEWLRADHVRDIYSASGCVSEDFSDWLNLWRHNSFWLFDSPRIIEKIAKEHGVCLDAMTLFFYQAYEQQWDIDLKEWMPYAPRSGFPLQIQQPKSSSIAGYDLTSYSNQTNAECSPLSCNHLAERVSVSEHCLLHSFDEAKALVETGALDDCEEGPYRILEVHTVESA